MDSRFFALVRAFQQASAEALEAVLLGTGLKHPFDRRAANVPREGTLNGDPPISYAFHGAGLRVQVGGREVDFDFGFDGRTGGFNAYWLSLFADNATEEFPEYRTREAVAVQLERGVASGEVVRPFLDRQDDLYYLAIDAATDT